MPVVILTTSALPQEAQRCRALGAAEIVRKPDSYDALVATLGRVVRAVPGQ